MKKMSKIYTGLIMLFLFAPIAILLVFSFNGAKSLSVFSGFSLNWYRELFRDAETLGAVRNTLVLALAAAVISTVMGTAAAVGINKLRNRAMRAADGHGAAGGGDGSRLHAGAGVYEGGDT